MISSFRRLAPLALLACATSPAALAQGDFQFIIDTNATNFTWDGTTSLGDIDTSPSNFSLSGTTGLDLTSGGNPVGTGQFADGGDALVTPNLHGEIANPLPFLPPLAEIDVDGLHFVLGSDLFNVDGAGNYSMLGTATVLQGTLVFDPLVGDTVTTDLTGFQSAPAVGTGTLGGGAPLTLTLSIDLVLSFSDPTSGVSGSVSLSGTLVADFGCPTPPIYCIAAPNSVGPGANISTNAQTSIAANALALNTAGLPANQFGIYYYGPDQVQIPFGEGFRCVGGSLIRLAPQNTGAGGTATAMIDFGALPPGGDVEAGDTRNVQFWYRDPAGGSAGFNFSDAAELFFCP